MYAGVRKITVKYCQVRESTVNYDQVRKKIFTTLNYGSVVNFGQVLKKTAKYGKVRSRSEKYGQVRSTTVEYGHGRFDHSQVKYCSEEYGSVR